MKTQPKGVVLFSLLTAALFIAMQSLSFAQHTATVANATADARIVENLQLSETQTLNFGDIIRDATGGTVAVSNAGVRTASPTTLISGIQTGTVKQAKFRVNGAPGYNYSITLPANGVAKLSKSGASDMALTGFNHNATLTLDGTGLEDFNVGATLNVNSNQTAGTYTGQYSVTVTYN